MGRGICRACSAARCRLLFWFIPRQLPCCTLFPYTTLFRSPVSGAAGRHGRRCHPPPRARQKKRSEEHTSELQSRGHLVCRLLLEKKEREAGAEGLRGATLWK